MKREYRVLANATLRAKKDARGIEGHAAVFNQLSEDLGGYRERIIPGAFSAHLASKPDVRALFNHDPNVILGRTRSGTLKLHEDDQGLAFDCTPPDTQAARDVMASVDRGDIDQCSFGFYPRRTKWSEEPDPADATGKQKMIVREIHEAEVFDVSPVTFPAYPQTDCQMRAWFPDGAPAEIRDHVPAFRGDEKTKRVDGADLPASCFAWVGDKEDTSSWKLPIHFPGDVEKTKTHIRNALSRFSQTKGIPAAQKSAVWHRIVGAAKAHGIEVSDEEGKNALRAIRAAGGDDAETCACECSACQNGNCSMCSDEDCDDENCDHGENDTAVDADRQAAMAEALEAKLRQLE